MKTLSSTPDLIARYSLLGSFAEHDFALRPTFQGVIAQLFKSLLQDQYPNLDTGSAVLWIAEPLANQPRGFRFMALADVLMQSYIDATPVSLIKGFHRLTTDLTVLAPQPLPVDLEQVQKLVNDCAPLVVDVYQQALAQFWSEANPLSISPFQWLQEVLQVGLHVTIPLLDLPNEQSAALAVAAHFPFKTARSKMAEETPLHTWLVNIQCVQATETLNFQLPGTVLITRQMSDRLLILSYSLSRGVEVFDSMQQFAGVLSRRLQGTLMGPSFTWSLQEPDGNLFTGLALTLLDEQLRHLAQLGQTAQEQLWSVGRLEQALDAAGGMFGFFSQQERSEFERVMSKLPLWLQQATGQEQLAYSKLMAAQANGQMQSRGQTFLDDIALLPQYAVQTLATRIQRDQPHSTLDVSKVEIHDVSIENLQLGLLTEEVIPLTEFALKYIGGKPAGLMTVSIQGGQPVPVWLTSGYVKGLLEELDIGSQYIALLKRLLIDDRVESARRQVLYKRQLSTQLPMLALEKKIRGQAGFTDNGWQMLDHLLNFDPASLCVRPLGFHAYEGAGVDYVANMFVFGSRDIQFGPFVLYRPFAADALLEFPTWAALMAAIKQPGELQELVLAWLDDEARGFYADGGFERPHLESVILEGTLAFLPRSAATLSTQYVVGDIFEALFQANAEALITLSDRQTVSRSERRWVLLKRYAWDVFNGLTFFVSGPLQKAAWLFQTLISLHSGLQARIDGDKEAARQTIIDLLLNISLTLLHEGLRFKAQANDGLRRKAPIDEPMFTLSEDEKPATVAAPEAAPLRQRKVSEFEDLDRFSTLDFSWFGPSLQLTDSQRIHLETFVADVDLSRETPMQTGPLRGVIQHQSKSFIRLDGKAYRVTRQADSLVLQDNLQPQRLGPPLRQDASGQWVLDLRLGLRGGGPKKRIQALRDDKNLKLAALFEEESRLLADLKKRDSVLVLTEELLKNHPDRQGPLLERLETEIGLWRKGMLELIRINTKCNKIFPVAAYEQRVQETWIQLVMKLFMLQNFLEEALRALPVTNDRRTYIPELIELVEDIKSGSSVAYEQWVTKLKDAQQIEARLFKNSVYESAAITEILKRPLPKDSALKSISDVYRRQYFDRHWGAVYLATLSELLIRRDATDLMPEEQFAFDMFGQGTLAETAWSQIHMRFYDVLYSNEHLDFFDNAIQQYNSAEGVCRNLMELGSEHFRNEYLIDTMSVIRHLRDFAEFQMESLIRESESSSSEQDEPRPGPSRLAGAPSSTARLPNPRQKIIKTTRKQTLVGIKREPVSDADSEIVDVSEGIDGLNFRSYRQVESGEWEEFGSTRPPILQVSHSKNLVKLEADARMLLGRFTRAILDNRESAATSRIPVEIEEILVYKAESMEDVANQIEQIVMATPVESESLTDERRTVVLALSAELKSSAVQLRNEGRSLRIQIIKRLPPTGPNVEYLHTQGDVTVSRAGPRRHLAKGQRKDYLQEYAINDKDGKALWFAHFHYAESQTPAENFEVAHLKTAEQRTWSEQGLYAKARTAHEYIQVYRAKLDKALALRLFLS